MRLAILSVCLGLAACALPPFEPGPTTTTPRQTPSAPSDIVVDVPENRRDRREERARAAAACAQYGRVEIRRANGEYACVAPGDRAPGADRN